MKYVAFVDGSYGEENGKALYGAVAIFAPENSNNWEVLKCVGNDPRYISHRNVAGEVLAVLQLCDYFIKNIKDCESLHICYDYVGIEKWPTKQWQAKKPLSQAYARYMQSIAIPQLHITFEHTKGHTGIEGNEIVDSIVHDLVSSKLRE